MLRLLAVFLFALQPAFAFALCGGTDLIEALPDNEHAALRAAARSEPYPEGLLWQATRGGTTFTFFGTYHFRHAQTDAHLERIKPLIDAADAIYLEISNEDQSAFERQIATDPSIMFLTTGPTLIDLLGDQEWQQFSSEMQARGIPSFLAAKFKPLWAAMMLGIGPCEAQENGLDANGIDQLVGDYAEAIGNPSRSLEDFAELLETLDNDPIEQQLNMIRLTLAWPGDADDMTYTVRERYLRQQNALIWLYARKISVEFGGETGAEDFDNFERVLLINRNIAWVDKLLQEPAGKSTFIAAGAGHLPGKWGVVYLLEKKGFTITRLPLFP